MSEGEATHWRVIFRAFDQEHKVYYPIELTEKEIRFRLRYITETYIFIKKTRVKLKWQKK